MFDIELILTAKEYFLIAILNILKQFGCFKWVVCLQLRKFECFTLALLCFVVSNFV